MYIILVQNWALLLKREAWFGEGGGWLFINIFNQIRLSRWIRQWSDVQINWLIPGNSSFSRFAAVVSLIFVGINFHNFCKNDSLRDTLIYEQWSIKSLNKIFSRNMIFDFIDSLITKFPKLVVNEYRWNSIAIFINSHYVLYSRGILQVLITYFSFPGATNETLLSKFNHHHKGKTYYQVPNVREEAFAVLHYAGKVKYQIKVTIDIVSFHAMNIYYCVHCLARLNV